MCVDHIGFFFNAGICTRIPTDFDRFYVDIFCGRGGSGHGGRKQEGKARGIVHEGKPMTVASLQDIKGRWTVKLIVIGALCD